jgi:threonine aldolase
MLPPNPQAHIVDLRSDTVTRPNAAMWEAMQSAPVGDDVLGDDPTVAALEAEAARLTGHEAAVFVPSGTMGNQAAIAAHTQPGDVMIIEEEAHILYYEVGAPAIFNGIVTRTVASENGKLPLERVRRAIMKASLHTPGTRVIALENTHNRAGGTVMSVTEMQAFRDLADEHQVALHCDGARIFNAAVALGVPVAELTRTCHSVSFCLSKGLGAPVGSVVVGGAAFMEKVRIWRKRLGGGMRQSGLLAAAGLVALREGPGFLAEDHRRAREFAHAMNALPGVKIDLDSVQTNIVIAEFSAGDGAWSEALKAQDIWALSPGPGRLRFVFHRDVDDEKLDRALLCARKIAEAL